MMKSLYVFWGKVKQGKKRGRLLGYPTANITLHKNIPQGIYISLIRIDNKLYQSVTFIGNAKTFDEKEVLAETFIFDFDKSIYGKWISISLFQKIRENEKFTSTETLISQIKKDIEIAKAFFVSFLTQ